MYIDNYSELYRHCSLQKAVNRLLVNSYLIDSSSQTTNIANISLEKLNPLAVAIPPLAEQHRIVAKVDELMSLCDQLSARLQASQTTLLQLAEALVEGALN